MDGEKYQEYQKNLNDIIRNCEGFPCKNDSFQNMQQLVDKAYLEYIVLEHQLKKAKKVIDKISKYLEKFIPIDEDIILMRIDQRDYLLNILKEASDEQNV